MLATTHYGLDLHDGLLRTLRRLGASLGVNYCRRDPANGGLREVQAVFASCRMDDWVDAFGEPHDVREHFDAARRRWIRSWEHQLPDGPVRCLGQFFQRAPGDDWVVVNQVSVCRPGGDSARN